MQIKFDRLGYHGRIGNSLFQFASTYGIAKTKGIDPRFNSNWLHRPYFSIPNQYFLIAEDAIEVTSLPELNHIDVANRGYLQDVGLFQECLGEIATLLQPSEVAKEILKERDQGFAELPHPILSVHVRRGDNVVDPGVPNKSDYYVLPSDRFYQDAIKELRTEAASVVCFSDDLEWCRSALDCDLYYEGVTRPKEHESDYLTAPVLDWIDIQLMAQCELFIVTGSTFGIWGALLSGSNKVIRPDVVYGPALTSINSELLFPKEWQVRSVC